jgi:hypothetical protein
VEENSKCSRFFHWMRNLPWVVSSIHCWKAPSVPDSTNPPSIYKSCSHPSTEWNAPSAAPDSRLRFQLDENLPNPGLDKCLV